MEEYNKILDLADGELVKLSDDFKKELHKKLALGMTRYVCRYGTLSDGHSKYTNAQKYFQSIKEMYHLGQSLKNDKVNAMLFQADLMDAQDDLENAEKESDKLRAKAHILKAETNLINSLVGAEDKMRQLDEFNKIRLELKDEVEAKYPHGIEQAEPDNWAAVGKAQAIKKERLDNVPLPPQEKAKLGLDYKRIDALVPMMLNEPEEYNRFISDESKKSEQKRLTGN